MITDIIIVINEDSQKEKIAKSKINCNPFWNFIDERTDRDKAIKFKRQYGTRMTPFAVAFKDLKPLKGFYGESNRDVIEHLVEFLNGNKWKIKE